MILSGIHIHGLAGLFTAGAGVGIAGDGILGVGTNHTGEDIMLGITGVGTTTITEIIIVMEEEPQTIALFIEEALI